MSRSKQVRIALFAVLMLVAAGLAAAWLSPREPAKGAFDFYVLSLSWSPSFCEAASERGDSERSRPQCSGRPLSFVVHGLWPQFEKGFPEYCQRPAPRVDREIVSSMLDLMPAAGLIVSQWNKHGTCSGLGARAYFDTVRNARAAVKIPEEYLQWSAQKALSPSEIEAAFIKVNPGLPASAIAVICDKARLGEVRICIGQDLRFRPCEDVNRRACRRDRVVMPPVRGG